MASDDHKITFEEFDSLFEKLKNWGRWGNDDELGALNFLGDADVVEAVKLVKTGRRVTLGRPLDTLAGPDNGHPALHYMTHMGDKRSDEPTYYTDFIGVDFHGKSASHMDALAHIAYKGLLYNGKPAGEVVVSTGSSFAPISRLAKGVVARGVLLDAASARGVDWVEPPAALGPSDLEDIAASLGVEVRRGDVVLLRSGQMARRRALGPGPRPVRGRPGRHGLGVAGPPPGCSPGWGRRQRRPAEPGRGRRRAGPCAGHKRPGYVPARQPRSRGFERGLRGSRLLRVPPGGRSSDRPRRDRFARQPDRCPIEGLFSRAKPGVLGM